MGVVSTLMVPTDVNAFLDWPWVWMDVCVLTHTCGAHAMVDTKEASVSNPCLVLLPSLNAVVPAPSMLSGSLANHVLHRIQPSIRRSAAVGQE